MTRDDPGPALPRLHTLQEVARALRCTERFAGEQVRLRRWPHVRMARGKPFFTDQDVAAILELQRQAVVEPAATALSFAPRSRRRR